MSVEKLIAHHDVMDVLRVCRKKVQGGVFSNVARASIVLKASSKSISYYRIVVGYRFLIMDCYPNPTISIINPMLNISEKSLLALYSGGLFQEVVFENVCFEQQSLSLEDLIEVIIFYVLRYYTLSLVFFEEKEGEGNRSVAEISWDGFTVNSVGIVST